MLGEQLERVGEIALDESLAGDDPPAFRPEDRLTLLAVAQDEVDDGVQVRLRLGELDTVPGELDRRLHQALPRPRPVHAVDVLQTRRRARHGARSRPDPEDLRGLDEADVDLLHLPRRRLPQTDARNGDEEVDQPARPVTGLSATHDTIAAAIHASTALPPSASTRAPASAVKGWPAAIAPLTDKSL